MDDKKAYEQAMAMLDAAEQLFHNAPVGSVDNGQLPLAEADRKAILEKVNEAWRFIQHNVTDERMREMALGACDALTVRVTGKPGDANYDPEKIHSSLRERFFESD